MIGTASTLHREFSTGNRNLKEPVDGPAVLTETQERNCYI
jgi:hypothetical protein